MADAHDEALRRKTAELQAILRALPDLFFRFDAEGRFLDFNAPMSSILYAPPEAFLGKHPRDVLPPALVEIMERVRAQTLATGALATMEYDLEVGGVIQQFEARYVPLFEGQTVAIVRNISDRRQAEAALRRSEARLRESQKIDAVGRLAGGVAHDFNNLLMIISGYATAVARHVQSQSGLSALREINKAVDRATALTKQLLALSRRQPLQPAVLDLGAIILDLASMLERVLGENIVFRTEIAEGLFRVRADRSQMEQIILNLALNARDAMPQGGAMTIRAHNLPPDDGAVGAGSLGQVALAVEDTGCGMDGETQARMFDPFFTTKARGTGLGLFTVHQITQDAGGKISVSSQCGVGTRITVQLPAVQGRPDPAPLEPGGPAPGGSETVLVVEDEEPVRALLVDVLRDLGYTVFSAANAGEALQQLADLSDSLALVLTDIVMPGASGWELAAAVTARCPGCRVLYMSGHAIGDEHAAPHLVPGELLHKPFTPEYLALRVRETLDRVEP